MKQKMTTNMFRQANSMPLQRDSALKKFILDTYRSKAASIDFALQGKDPPLSDSTKYLLTEIAGDHVPQQERCGATCPVPKFGEGYQQTPVQKDYTVYSAPISDNPLPMSEDIAVREMDGEHAAITDDFTTYRIRKELNPLELLKLDKYAKPWGNAFLDFIYDGMKNRERIACTFIMRRVNSIRRSMNNVQQALAAFAYTNHGRGYAAVGSGVFK